MDKGYGTLPVLGVRYQRGTGAIRLLYCGITALAISVIRCLPKACEQSKMMSNSLVLDEESKFSIARIITEA